GHYLEAMVHGAVRDGSAEIKEVLAAAKPALEKIVSSLQAQSLVLPDAQAMKARFIPLAIAAIALLAGVMKMLIGTSRGKAIGFLAVLFFVSLVASLLIFARRPWRTRRGDAVLARLREQHGSVRRIGSTATDVALMIGLFGMSALAGSELNDLRRSLQPMAN